MCRLSPFAFALGNHWLHKHWAAPAIASVRGVSSDLDGSGSKYRCTACCPRCLGRLAVGLESPDPVLRVVSTPVLDRSPAAMWCSGQPLIFYDLNINSLQQRMKVLAKDFLS